MLTQEQNDRLCRIGPGTPMGALFRRFWLPICTADKVREPGGRPRPERLLGENLVVFRTTKGTLCVLDEFCIHRSASLALGRVEEDGIRCLYHGWKFGLDGSVLEMMNVPRDKRIPRLEAPSYPVVESGGIVWTYLGPKEHQPAFSPFAYMALPEENQVVVRVDTNANWVQHLEGGLDESHVSILHTNAARPGWAGGDGQVGALDDTRPNFEIEDTEFGYHYASFRQENERTNVRVCSFIMPSGRIIPGGALQGANNATIVFEIPIDDEHTATYSVRYGSRPITRESRLRETGYDNPTLYAPEQQRFLFSRRDFHLQDRASMDRNWSGFRGISTEDAVIAISMGPIPDRTKEHLISSDVAVVRMRRRLLDAADAVEAGRDLKSARADRGCIGAVDAAAPAGDGHWRSLVPSHAVE